MASVYELKRAIRTSIKSALKTLGSDTMQRESQAIAGQVIASSYFKRASALCIYVHCAKLREVDTTAILDAAYESGKRCYVPLVADRAANMKLLHLGVAAGLSAGAAAGASAGAAGVSPGAAAACELDVVILGDGRLLTPCLLDAAASNPLALAAQGQVGLGRSEGVEGGGALDDEEEKENGFHCLMPWFHLPSSKLT
ncbi:5-formyltetrahydrofolate cyclo-ligase [Haematococcus lacustris]|uniref:5-formyltetrahydrofolate cyclo-ligase n=1 Tax=Haematococcus lacustris TaxID=44745 RepID=A0A699YNH0_HAELA|nr:5-formyltetrahydrofolate cyclo-ligase [Haematococcus lacustris]